MEGHLESVRALVLVIFVLVTIAAAAVAVTITVNMVVGGKPYLTGSSDRDLIVLVNILSTSLLAIMWRRWRKTATRTNTTVPESDHLI